MNGTLRVGTIRKTAFLSLAAAILSGCLSSQSEGESTQSLWKKREAIDLNLTGSVGDGPAAGASVTITAATGQLLAETKSDDTGRYAVALTVAEDRTPLFIEAIGGTDIITNEPPDFTLLSAAWKVGEETTANVNPFSTFAVEIARDLNGGLTADNLARGQEIIVGALGNALTSLAETGPIETLIDETNVAEIVLASEATGEIVRRTRDALNAAGYRTTGDQIVQRLGSDLVDTVIEGKGGARADARTAAVATLVAAQVALESMTNTLRVNGKDASEAMKLAIERIANGVAQPTLDELTSTPNLIASARIGLDAAMAVSENPAVERVRNAVSGLKPGMDPFMVRGLLPTGFTRDLEEAIAAAAGGDSTMYGAINAVARKGNNGTPVVENRPPVVSGTPQTSVKVSATYNFKPSASDLDDDSLSWSITSKPGWATFVSSTGRLSGIPQAGDVGTYDNIRISVSDGEMTTELEPFSITVTDPNSATESVELSWTAPIENEDGSVLTDLAGYRIYWGTTRGIHPNSVTIDNPSVTTYVVQNLTPGTYEFVATTVNSAGVESRFSNTVSKTAR